MIELLLSAIAAAFSQARWLPVRFHNLSYLPHPFLGQTLLQAATNDPNWSNKSSTPAPSPPASASKTGQRVEAELQAHEVSQLIASNNLGNLIELTGTWLPGKAAASPALLAFSEAAQYLSAARASANPHHRLGHLDRFTERLRGLENQLRQDSGALVEPFRKPLLPLQAIASEERAHAQTAASATLQNPFRIGNPLSPEEGPELFVGREQAVREIEDLLVDSSRSASLVLIAPRRCRKTPLLKMLPAKLPDTVCVFFDLLQNQAGSPAAFFRQLSEQASIAARRDRRLELPPCRMGRPLKRPRNGWIESRTPLDPAASCSPSTSLRASSFSIPATLAN